jgi:hypothetical protein
MSAKVAPALQLASTLGSVIEPVFFERAWRLDLN